MKNYHSELTFGELTKNLAYIKVIWNGKVIFDDDYDSIEEMNKMEDKYNDKLVYEMGVKVVDFHHCILDIVGEKV